MFFLYKTRRNNRMALILRLKVPAGPMEAFSGQANEGLHVDLENLRE